MKTLDTTSAACSTFTRSTVHPSHLLRSRSTPSLPACLNPSREESSTILLVEDDSALREMLANYLKELGYDVLEASNGIEALGLFQSNQGKIQLLFTDIDMPLMDGLQLAREVRGLDPTLKVLFTSGNIPDEVSIQGDVAAVAMLLKPYPLDILNEKIKQCLIHARN